MAYLTNYPQSPALLNKQDMFTYIFTSSKKKRDIMVRGPIEYPLMLWTCNPSTLFLKGLAAYPLTDPLQHLTRAEPSRHLAEVLLALGIPIEVCLQVPSF